MPVAHNVTNIVHPYTVPVLPAFHKLFEHSALHLCGLALEISPSILLFKVNNLLHLESHEPDYTNQKELRLNQKYYS